MALPGPTRIALTGGAGFIGSHLAEALLAAGHSVLVIDDLSTGREANLPPGVEFHPLDIRSDEAAVLLETAGAEVLIHQAAQMNVRRSVEDPAYDADINILGTLNLLEAAVRGGLRRVLFASTGGAIYGEQDDLPCREDQPLRPVSPYGVAKLAVERYLYAYHVNEGLDVVCLRYANVYGERQNPLGEAGVVAIFLERLLAGEAVRIHGDGLQTRDYVHVSDVVRANLAALRETGFSVFNVGTGRETSVVDLFERLQDAVGIKGEAIHGPAKAGEQRRSAIDPSKGLAELELAPPLDLEEGLARTAAWFREAAVG